MKLIHLIVKELIFQLSIGLTEFLSKITARYYLVVILSMIILQNDTSNGQAQSYDCENIKEVVAGKFLNTLRIRHQSSGPGYSCDVRRAYFTDVMFVWVIFDQLSAADAKKVSVIWSRDYFDRKLDVYGPSDHSKFVRIRQGLYLKIFSGPNSIVAQDEKARRLGIIGQRIHAIVEIDGSITTRYSVVFNPVNPIQTSFLASLDGLINFGIQSVVEDVLANDSMLFPEDIFNDAHIDILINSLVNELVRKAPNIDINRAIELAVSSIQLKLNLNSGAAAFMRGFLKRMSSDIFRGLFIDRSVHVESGQFRSR